jgi:phosphate transport system protein
LDHTVVDLCSQVRRATQDASNAALREDLALAEAVIGSVADIQESARSIRCQAEGLVARQQPVAQDLRQLLTAQRHAAHLEGMGVLAGRMAKLTRRRYPRTVVPHEVRGVVADMAGLTDRLMRMLGEALSAGKVSYPGVLVEIHNQVNHLNEEMQAIVRSPAWPHDVAAAIDMSMLSRDFQRLAEHSLEIAAGVDYVATVQSA